MPKIKYTIPTLAILSFLFLFSSGGTAQSLPSPAADNDIRQSATQQEIDESLTVTADNAEYMESENKVLLSGNVHIEMNNFDLVTSELLINKNEKTITSESEITIKTNNLEFTGNKLNYNYEEEKGTFEEGRITIEGINLSSREIDITPDVITMHGMKCSTCELDKPDYYVTARSLEMRSDGKARFSGIAFYLFNRHVFGWKSYTASFGPKKQAAKPVSAAQKKWTFSPPAMRYAKFGGLEIRSGVRRPQKKNIYGLYFDYYFREGMFTEARIDRTPRPGGPEFSLRLGRQYKENQGYFPNTAPMTVNNLPMLQVKLPKSNIPGTRLTYSGTLEAGRLKEEQISNPTSRYFAKLNTAYPLNPGMKTVISLVADGRFAMYPNWRKYEVLGTGLSTEFGNEDTNYLFIEYLMFDDNGATPFISDLVNTDDKLFFYGSHTISTRTTLYADMQYDLDLSKTDELILGAARKYDCVKFRVNMHTKSKRVGINMEILGAGRK